MMKVVCIAPEFCSSEEKWPKQLPCVPSVGQRITSAKEWPTGNRLTLVVARIDWVPDPDEKEGDIWMPALTLGIPADRPGIFDYDALTGPRQ